MVFLLTRLRCTSFATCRRHPSGERDIAVPDVARRVQNRGLRDMELGLYSIRENAYLEVSLIEYGVAGQMLVGSC